MALKVIQDLIPINHPNRPGYKIQNTMARVWHGTSNIKPGSTDTANRNYFARPYKKVYNKEKGKNEYFEANGNPFRFGSAHVIIDKDSATICIPFDEVAYHCGDRNGTYDETYKGQTQLAHDIFENEQNKYTVGLELCMNDMSAWEQVLANAVEFVTLYMPTDMLDIRHFDLTYKNCPSPLVGQYGTGSDEKWDAFRGSVKSSIAAMKHKKEHPIVIVDGDDLTDTMDVKPFIKDGRVMVPVRFIAEAFHKKVEWDTQKNAVVITSM